MSASRPWAGTLLWVCFPAIVAARTLAAASEAYRRYYGYAADDAFTPPVALARGRWARTTNGGRWRSGYDYPTGVLGEGFAVPDAAGGRAA